MNTNNKPAEHMQCEVCPVIGPCVKYMTIMMCVSCLLKEKSLQANNNEPAAIQSRVNESKSIDQSVQLRSDIFNAQTVSINELRSVIEADETIAADQKNFTLAKELKVRYDHFKKVIFEMNDSMVNKANEQRAIQTYLNDLSNKLRTEERESLKIQDINYKPGTVKISKPRETTKSKKFDKADIKKYALEVGVPESVLQMICVAKNMTPEQAMNELKRNMS